MSRRRKFGRGIEDSLEPLEYRTLPAAAILADLLPGTASSNPRYFETVGETTYFAAYTSDSNDIDGLWRTDGTASGTQFLVDLPTGVYRLLALGDQLLIMSRTASNQTAVYVFNQQENRVDAVGEFPGAAIETFVADRLVLFANDGAWSTDGTAAGTFLLRAKGYELLNLTEPRSDSFLFVEGTQLWSSDGTLSGTAAIADLSPVADASLYQYRSEPAISVVPFAPADRTAIIGLESAANRPAGFVAPAADGKVHFVARYEKERIIQHPDHSQAIFTQLRDELFETDGTASGTMRIASLDSYLYLSPSDNIVASDADQIGDQIAPVGSGYVYTVHRQHYQYFGKYDESLSDEVINWDIRIFPADVDPFDRDGQTYYETRLFEVNGTAMMYGISEDRQTATVRTATEVLAADVPVSDVAPVVINDRFLFVVPGANGQFEIRVSDGTLAETTTVYSGTGTVERFFRLAGFAGIEVQHSDSVPPVELLLSDTSVSQFDDFLSPDFRVDYNFLHRNVDSGNAYLTFFLDGDAQTWMVDSAGDIRKIGHVAVPGYAAELALGTLIFESSDQLHGSELWFGTPDPPVGQVDQLFMLDPDRPLLDWADDVDTMENRVWMKHLESGKIVLNGSVSASQYQIDEDLPAGSYEFWAKAVDADGVGVWSGPSLFSIQGPPGFGYVPSTRSFVWRETPDAVSYQLWIRDVDAAVKLLDVDDLPGASYQLAEALTVGHYRVWMRSQYQDGSYSDWSKGLELEITGVSQPTAPQESFEYRTHQIGSSQHTYGNHQFSWAPVDGAVSYELWLRHDGTGMKQLHEKELTATSLDYFTADLESQNPQFVVGQLRPLDTGPYTVWVRAAYSDGSTSKWSPGTRFDVQPEAPFVDQIGFQPWKIDWLEVAGVTSYDLYLRRVGSSTPLLNLTGINDPEYTFAESPPEGNYEYWIRARYPNGKVTRWSNRSSLTVARYAALARATPLATSATGLEWSFVANATGYEIWVNEIDATAKTLRSKALYIAEQSETSLTFPTSLTPGHYRAWIRALQNEGGTIEYSDYWAAVTFDIA